jgi:hypothetical protein
MKRLIASGFLLLAAACATPPKPTLLACQLVFTDEKGVEFEHVALHALPGAPGVNEHEGIFCGTELLQGRKRLPQIGALSSEAWVFYVYGDRLAKESRIEARFYPAGEGEKSMRARAVNLASDEPLCVEVTRQPLSIPKIRVDGNQLVSLRLLCGGQAPSP